MKIVSIKSKPKFKTVNFHGNEFDNVPEDAEYISADRDGDVYSYVLIPSPAAGGLWAGWGHSKIGRVDLEGMDWRDTLVEI